MQSGSTLLRGVPGDRHSRPDQEALAFLERYRMAFNWCINGYAIPRHQREDVLQEVHIRILQRFRKHGPLQEGPGAGSHLGYAITICRNVCLNHMRAQASRPSAAVHEGAVELVVDRAALPHDLLERKDAHNRLHLAVASLPPLGRAVMREVLKGRTLVEIAADFDITEANAKVIAHRARTLLRKRLVRQ